MTREEAISEWTFRSNHIKKWLDEYGEEPSIRHYVELIDMAIEALQREEAEEKGYCHRIKPKEYLKNDAMQKLREMPRYLNGVKAKQITKISAELTLQTPQTYGKSINPSNAEVAEDLISRADAIDALYAYQDAVRIIKALPSVERPKGEWVRKYDGKINCYWYECDQCGEYRPRNQFGNEYNANFCPNCGAKMGGDTE